MKKEMEKNMEENMEENIKKDDITCFICNKKLKLTSIECKCGNYYCKIHKNEIVHNCNFNYRLQEKDRLEKCLPIINARKI